MLWGCLPASGTGWGVGVEGRIDPTKYQQTLEANVPGSVNERGWIFHKTTIQKIHQNQP